MRLSSPRVAGDLDKALPLPYHEEHRTAYRYTRPIRLKAVQTEPDCGENLQASLFYYGRRRQLIFTKIEWPETTEFKFDLI